MPNYSYIVSNSFQPFTFQEMLAPYATYKEEYDKQQEAADKIAEKALVWDNMVNQETDPDTYQKIKSYTDALKSQAASFAEHGITVGSSGALSDLRRRYTSEMTPIEQGYAAKKAQITEQLKAKAQDPTLIISRRADTTSLDDYVKNPMMSYEVLSGASLTKRVATQATSLANQLTKAENYGELDDYTKLWMQQYGFTSSQVLQAINNPGAEESTKVLNAIVDSVIDSSGIKNWGDQEALSTARMYANEGLYSAIGKQQVQQYEDYAERLEKQAEIEEDANKKQYEQQLKLAQIKAQSKGGTNNGSGRTGNTSHVTRISEPIKIKRKDKSKNIFTAPDYDKSEGFDKEATVYTYNELSEAWKKEANKIIGNDLPDNYIYKYSAKNDELLIEPKSSVSDTYWINDGGLDTEAGL